MINLKILAITHQLDFSGAPVALFEALKILKSGGYDIDIISLKNDEGLANSFIENGIQFLSGSVNTEDYDFVIFNTLLTIKYIPKHKGRAKYIAWVHESPYLAGLAWNPDIQIENISLADAVIFPSNSSRNEWSQYIDTKNSFNFFSPISIPDEVKSISEDLKPSEIMRLCIIDPRESYRGIERIESFLKTINYPLEVHFIGSTGDPQLLGSKFITANYYGRVTREVTLRILASCDIYLSATCMATQNRGLCEALSLNKSIFLSSINVHREIGSIFNIPTKKYFSPLENINICLEKSSSNYKNLDLLNDTSFFNNFVSVLNYTKDSR